MSTDRKAHTKKVKFQAALELISEKHTLAELCQKYGVHQRVLYRWKKELLENGSSLFDRKTRPKLESRELDSLERKVGQLTMENDFLKKALGK
jgi:transposase-like protein